MSNEEERDEDTEEVNEKRFDLKGAIFKLLFASVAAIIAYSLVEPLKSVTKYYIWRENIELNENANAVVGVPHGYQFSLVNKSAVAGISGGTIHFSHEGPELEIIGKSKFIFSASDESITVPTEERLGFVTHREGEHRILAEIKTQRGATFNGQVLVNTLPRILITQKDYSGLWHVAFNGIEGSMQIQQEPPPDRHFGGRIELQNGKVLQILEGPSKWDGRTLIIWALDEQGNEYNIQSRKCRVEIDGTFWVFAHGDYKVTRKDGSTDIIKYQSPTYIEECPGGVEINPRRDSGHFFARAESR